ncbi:anthranilate synthase component 1 [Saitoella complicata NRRL Y-17804]|uniref:anthranilate synthase component 1 n=1 Tax=Saitoella complicata (strain BCRC 22490 / CBS 7301 / JCM 7358 / NBRC 10748 / NRRL Y-17804) TaxID=698492 RepID=UPI000866C935|nr:anthranilate synthase component 1 [Saitoella complicata NRRL Y-17804]ODQ50693.1 anthranilate synthase component 1 [Saitoella complicata NRRL Y-17804]
MPKITVQPPIDQLESIIASTSPRPNIIPVYATIPGDFLTPSAAYLKLSEKSKYSFLLESVAGGEQLGRYSFIGADPYRVIKTGAGHGPDVDPLIELEKVLDGYNTATVPGVPPFPGGAIGYISYDCVKYFEPRTKRELRDPLGIPESLLFFHDSVVAFDNIFQSIKVVSHVHLEDSKPLSEAYADAAAKIQKIVDTLSQPHTPVPHQPPVKPDNEYQSNIGREGYEGFVHRLKGHIKKGDIIQAVPSQRMTRKTSLHPFNVYRHLRTVNPSPYMFYIDCADFQIVGASPELLVKSEAGRIITHPIAGTVKRGKDSDEDDRLASELLASTKDRAEHVMLVDLARNDINRVCELKTSRVDRLMTVERFSHVMHLVSQVSGVLRKGMTRFDAFRSIFPAGTVSGAPKVRAMELIGELEGERRGVYAGAVGRWGYDQDSMDTCIAIRTMMFKDGAAYLQAGGGIVHDSDAYDEWMETINKLKANMTCIVDAEKLYIGREEEASGLSKEEETGEAPANGNGKKHKDVGFAA